KVTREATWLETWPRATPIALPIKENSLICATVNPAWKLTLRGYPDNCIKIYTMMGLPIKTNPDSNMSGQTLDRKSTRNRQLPSSRKKMTKKKSLSGLSLEEISSAKVLLDRAMPATSAPTSIDRPAALNKLATPMPQVTALKKSSSLELAAWSKNRGITNL